jgi:putative DNA primase/helicase
MKAILLARGIKFWVLDNLASLAGGIDENSSRDWSPINSWLLDLRFAGITTALLHHTGKSGDQRGTSAREDNLDCSLTLRQPPDYVPEDGARFIVSFKKARVSTSDLALISDTQFHLCEDRDGCLVWAWGNVKKEMRAEVLRAFDEGMKGKEIAEALGISKGWVSKIKAQAIKDCYLTPKGKLTQSGFLTVQQETG